MSKESVRLFVALELPAVVRSQLGGWRDAVVAREPGLRPVGEEALHVTLCFLGATAASAVPEILAALGVVSSMPAAELSVAEPLWLPRRRPHVLAVSLTDRGGFLAAAQGAVAAALAAGGWYEAEARPFLAHVTVARVRRSARIRTRELAAPDPMTFVATTVTLFRSRLGRGGAQYEGLGSAALSPSS